MHTGVSDRVPGAQSRVAELEEDAEVAAEIEYEDVRWPFTEADTEAAEEANEEEDSVVSGKDMDSTAYFYKYGRRKPVEVSPLFHHTNTHNTHKTHETHCTNSICHTFLTVG